MSHMPGRLSVDEVMDQANALYATAKLSKAGVDARYTAPECFPAIASDQVKALAHALVNCINVALREQRDRDWVMYHQRHR